MKLAALSLIEDFVDDLIMKANRFNWVCLNTRCSEYNINAFSQMTDIIKFRSDNMSKTISAVLLTYKKSSEECLLEIEFTSEKGTIYEIPLTPDDESVLKKSGEKHFLKH